MNYAKKDPSLVLIKLADMYETPTRLPQASVEHIKKRFGKRAKTFWIPFFKEIGLTEFANKLYNYVNKYYKKKEKITLYNYISKENLRKIKKKLEKLK